MFSQVIKNPSKASVFDFSQELHRPKVLSVDHSETIPFQAIQQTWVAISQIIVKYWHRRAACIKYQKSCHAAWILYLETEHTVLTSFLHHPSDNSALVTYENAKLAAAVEYWESLGVKNHNITPTTPSRLLVGRKTTTTRLATQILK